MAGTPLSTEDNAPFWAAIIDKYYPVGSPLRDIYLRHSTQVAALALLINSSLPRPLDPADVEAAAMLHDIGIFLTHAPGIECHGEEHYLRHGFLGADLLRGIGVHERFAAVCERHTGTGITEEERTDNNLPLPPGRTYLPQTPLEKLICYADKYYSKSGSDKAKPRRKVIKSLQRFGQDAVTRFTDIERDLGIPLHILPGD